MTVTIDLSPQDEARLEALANREGMDLPSLLKQLVTKNLPQEAQETTGQDATLTLLQSWLDEAPTDPDEIREAEQEIEEFKRALNANRRATGERILFP